MRRVQKIKQIERDIADEHKLREEMKWTTEETERLPKQIL